MCWWQHRGLGRGGPPQPDPADRPHPHPRPAASHARAEVTGAYRATIGNTSYLSSGQELVMLSCEVECWPPCRLGWYREGEFVKTQDPRHQVSSSQDPDQRTFR